MRKATPLRALLIACTVMAAAFAAHAQDARETAVQTAARDWLALTDRLDAANSLQTAGAKFRAQLTAESWAKALRSAREPLGAAQQRAAVSTAFRKDIPGGPDGNYALLQFRTAFANKSEGHESVTLELESDGVWRVIGYFIR